MWNCPICNSEKDTLLCPNCGFDESKDYRNHRSFGALSEISGKVFKIEESADNILMKSIYTGYIFGKRMRRKQIKKVYFQNHKSKIGANAWDVSEKQDGSVLAWTEDAGDGKLELYIAADGKIKANKDCSDLFNGYTNLEEIFGLEFFKTDQAETMEHMFYECKKLSSLDLSDFDTSHVTNMRNMFSFCEKLEKLDLSGFDTSRVTNMQRMFIFCRNLQSLDVSHFDTSQVTDMKDMFAGCNSLKTLDVSQFDTGSVTNMSASLAKYLYIPREVDAGIKTEEQGGFFHKLWKK